MKRAKGDKGMTLLTPYKGSNNIRAEAREIKLNEEPPSKLENGFGFVVLAIVWIVVFEDVDAADMFFKKKLEKKVWWMGKQKIRYNWEER